MDADDNHRERAERSSNFSPEYCVQVGPNEVDEMLMTVFEHYTAEDASIPELGCSSSRHLAHLHDHDYENITSIGINDDSFKMMAEYFPELVDIGAFLTGVIEDLLPGFPDDKLGVIYSIETLQHVRPDDTWVFEEIARVSSDLVITAEDEGNGPTRRRSGFEMSYVNDDSPLYCRDRKDEFSEFGLVRLLYEPDKRNTVRVFRVL